jgi:hypothetical protein
MRISFQETLAIRIDLSFDFIHSMQINVININPLFKNVCRLPKFCQNLNNL